MTRTAGLAAVIVLGVMAGCSRSPEAAPPPANAGPKSNPEFGVEPGVPDPDGRPRTMGPRSRSVCVRQAGSASGSALQRYAGSVQLAPDVRTGKTGVTTVVATDVAVTGWHQASRVQLFESVFTRGATFEVNVRAAPRPLKLCAIRTEDYQGFAYVHAAGCVELPAAGASGLALILSELEQPLELIGFHGLVPAAAWPGSQERRVSGRVTLEGSAGGAFLVALADFPILDNPDAESNPSALAVTAPDGLFDVRFLSRPDAALHVCALGVPAPGVDIRTLAQLRGSACVKVPVPADAGQSARMADVSVALDGKRTLELTHHEQEHFDYLARCLSDWGSPAGK